MFLKYVKDTKGLEFTEEELDDYITNKAREYLEGKSGAVEDSVVFEWIQNFIDVDCIKIREEKKAEEKKRKAEEAKEKAEKPKKVEEKKNEEKVAEVKELTLFDF